MKSLDLVLLNGEVFSPGQTMYGRVVCHNTNPFNCRSIKLKIKGKGYVYWTESHTRSTTVDGKTTTHTETESYTKNERYFKHEFHLFGSGQKTTLEPGERAFEFSFTLPSQIPSSFSDKYCEIIYSVKVKVDLPWAVDIKSKRHFFVRDYMVLNELPSAMERVENSDSKHVCCCCCRSGPITCRCWLPKRGYVPGESISFSAELENSSNRTMEGSYLKLQQSIKYHATNKTKTVSNTIYSANRPAFQREDYWSDFRITIPPVSPSPFRFTGLLTIDYEVKISVDPGSCSSNLNVKLPIMIGSDCPVPAGQFGNDTVPYQPNPISYPNAPTGFIAPHLPQADVGIGFSAVPMPYSTNPGHPPPIEAGSGVPDSSLPYPINSGQPPLSCYPTPDPGFTPPGPPHAGGYTYYPVPCAPIEDLRPITEPPKTTSAMGPIQEEYSDKLVADAIIHEPVSHSESPHAPGMGSYSTVYSAPVPQASAPEAPGPPTAAPPVMNPDVDPPRYTINTSVPFSYTPLIQ